jgi:membrane protease YdiL (CAAX protease family)
MNTDAKSGVGYPSQVGTLTFEECRRSKLSSRLARSATLNYADVGFFFFCVFLLAVGFRMAVHLHVFRQTTIDKPNLLFQVVISVFLIASLYAIVRLRHGRDAWRLLGWIRPARIHVVAALVGGICAGLGIDLIARATTPTTHVIHLWNLILLDALLGPVIEESFFRGCLLPVVARTAGPLIAILVTAILFATLHPIRSIIQWLCFVATGIAFGWIRVESGSTTASTLMHTVYNATLFFCQAV